MPSRLQIFLLIIFLSSISFAKDVTVFDVRRPLAMDDSQHTPKDFYINAGSNDGMKVGMIVAVQRRQALYDVYQNKSPGDLVVMVGQLRIIHVQAEISVARLESITKNDESPAVDFDAVMVGDKVDLSSARMGPRKTAALEESSMPVEIKLDVSAPLPATSPSPAANKTDFSSTAPQGTVTSGSPL